MRVVTENRIEDILLAVRLRKIRKIAKEIQSLKLTEKQEEHFDDMLSRLVSMNSSELFDKSPIYITKLKNFKRAI